MTGTSHFAHAGQPDDAAVAKEYAIGPTSELADRLRRGQQGRAAEKEDVGEIARAIVGIVRMPFGTRPFRTIIDPIDGGADVVSAVADRIRVEAFQRLGILDLLKPAIR